MELVSRGHTAAMIHMQDVAHLLAPGIEFVPVGARSHPVGTLDAIIGRINSLTSAPAAASLAGAYGFVRSLYPVLGDLAASTDMLADEAPAVLCRLGTELIVADQTEAAGGLIARHLGLPFVSVANALPINEEPSLPPPFTNWAYDRSPAGRRRNQVGYRISRLLSRRLNRVIARRARQWALGPLSSLTDCLSPTTQLSQMVPTLDFPRCELPPGFAYTGPLRQPEIHDCGVTPDRPFVFATLGTLQGARLDVFRAIAEACHRLDLGCMIAHGGRLTAAGAASLPGAPIVLGFAPQRPILRRAILAVTHGGLNTVLDALAVGTPVVVIPLAFEQAAIAARVDRAGVGRTVPFVPKHGQMVAALRTAIDAILSDRGYADRAAAIAGEIAATGGVRTAADAIEALLRHPM